MLENIVIQVDKRQTSVTEHCDTPCFKICYLLLQIPAPSETFVINEISALQSLGADIFTISLWPPQSCHEELMACIQNPVYYLSDYPVQRKATSSKFYSVACTLAASFNISLSLATQAALAADYVTANAINHIHAHFATEASLVALLVSKLTNIPYSITAHAYDIFMPNIAGEALPNRRVKLLVENAAKVITVSEFNRKHILSITDQAFSDKLEVVHCGIDMERFKPNKRNGNGTFTFLSVGRLISKKGHDYLLRSFKKVVGTCDSRLRIIGAGPLLPDLQTLSKELKIYDKVTFIGAVSSDVVLKEMQHADVFVLHSLTGEDGNKEGIPVAIMEACATGLPVVATRHSGIPELILEGESGILVDEKDWNGFAGAMLTFATSPELRVKMGQVGRSIIARKFNMLHEANKLKEIFLSIIDKFATAREKEVSKLRYIVTSCYNCHSDERVFYAAENGYKLVKCCKCGLLYMDERPEDIEISQAHKQGNHSGLTVLNVSEVFVESNVANYLKVLNDIFKGDIDGNKKWLDIGCGFGEFITALQNYSQGTLNVTGSEPNIYKQESARRRGLNVGYFDIQSHHAKYDVISLLNVYSHLPNPPEFLQSLKKNLNQKGEIIIETGDTADLAASYHYRPFYLPDHLSFASESIVSKILVSLGFEIISINKYPYPYLPQSLMNPTRIAKEISKVMFPSHKSILKEYFKYYLYKKRWSKTDMYIRAKLVS